MNVCACIRLYICTHNLNLSLSLALSLSRARTHTHLHITHTHTPSPSLSLTSMTPCPCAARRWRRLKSLARWKRISRTSGEPLRTASSRSRRECSKIWAGCQNLHAHVHTQRHARMHARMHMPMSAHTDKYTDTRMSKMCVCAGADTRISIRSRHPRFWRTHVCARAPNARVCTCARAHSPTRARLTYTCAPEMFVPP